MRTASTAAMATLVPLLAVANGIAVLIHPWFVRFEYQRSGFPVDPFGLAEPERTRLARVGLRSVQPWDDAGIRRLEEARFSEGGPAFGGREIRHMRQVRYRIDGLLGLDAVALPTLLGLAAVRRTRPAVRLGLRFGAIGTLGLGAAVAALLAVNPIGFLTGFHEVVFFSGSSWRFADDDTLRRLYPDRFWQDTAVLLGAAAGGQALAVLAATGGVRRRRTIPACRTGS